MATAQSRLRSCCFDLQGSSASDCPLSIAAVPFTAAERVAVLRNLLVDLLLKEHHIVPTC